MVDAAVQGAPLVWAQQYGAGQVRVKPREHACIDDAPGDHGVHTEQTLQSREGCQLTCFDAAAAFERAVPDFDSPAPGVP